MLVFFTVQDTEKMGRVMSKESNKTANRKDRYDHTAETIIMQIENSLKPWTKPWREGPGLVILLKKVNSSSFVKLSFSVYMFS